MINIGLQTGCFLFHDWTKWEPYQWKGTVIPIWGKAAGQKIPSTEIRQRRHCMTCGKTQDEEIHW